MKKATNRVTKMPKLEEMPNLEIGNQLFHNGVPVRLLYQISRGDRHETWRVRPLFVEGPDRDEQFAPSDSLSFLHTMRAPRWLCAA